MTRNAFWKTIDEARSATQKLVDVPVWLVDHLSQLDEREIIDFVCTFRIADTPRMTPRLWLGAVVILGGCSDDTFDGFRGWLIAQGREAFDSALAVPDSMADLENFDGDDGYPV